MTSPDRLAKRTLRPSSRNLNPTRVGLPSFGSTCATLEASIAASLVTMLPGPPTLYQGLLAAAWREHDLSSLRLAITGAASVPHSCPRRRNRSRGGMRSRRLGCGASCLFKPLASAHATWPGSAGERGAELEAELGRQEQAGPAVTLGEAAVE